MIEVGFACLKDNVRFPTAGLEAIDAVEVIDTQELLIAGVYVLLRINDAWR